MPRLTVSASLTALTLALSGKENGAAVASPDAVEAEDVVADDDLDEAA